MQGLSLFFVHERTIIQEVKSIVAITLEKLIGAQASDVLGNILCYSNRMEAEFTQYLNPVFVGPSSKT